MKRITCPNCCGMGRYRDYGYFNKEVYVTCWKCGGMGYIDKEE